MSPKAPRLAYLCQGCPWFRRPAFGAPFTGEAIILIQEPQGEEVQAQQAYKDAAIIIHRLAETIDEEELRAGFLAAGPVRSVLEMSEV